MIHYSKITKKQWEEKIRELVESEFQRRFKGHSDPLERQVGRVFGTAMTEQIYNDLSTVEFGLDNIETEEYDGVGFQCIDDFYYFGIVAHGDDELPVYFLLYLDDKDVLRAYIPTEGNLFDKETKKAMEAPFLDEIDEDEDEYDIERIEEEIKKMLEI